MKLSPPRVPQQRLVFARDRLARVTTAELEIRRAKDLSLELRLPLDGARQVVALVDGSIVCLTASGIVRIRPHQTKPERTSRPSAFAQSLLIGDRVRPDRLWVMHGFGSTVFGYDAVPDAPSPGPLLPIAQAVELPDFVQRSATMLADGAFFYTSGSGFVHAFAGGRHRSIGGESANVARLMPAKRVDRVWIVRDDGRLELDQISDRLHPIQSIRLDSVPFDVAVSSVLVAVLMLVQPDDGPKSFVIEVYDRKGKRRVREQYVPTVGLVEGWATHLLENAELALSADPPRIAVGGRSDLAVWSFDGDPERLPLP
jgi:hypothetical protein